MDEVTRIRGRIDHLDKDLLQLIKSRYELAHQLGRIKRDRGIPIGDPNRERKILTEAGRIAKAEHLPREQVRRIFRQIFDIAVEAQRSKNQPTTRQQSAVLIVGGTGGMGKLFARLLANQGCLVRILGRSCSSRQFQRGTFIFSSIIYRPPWKSEEIFTESLTIIRQE